MLWFVRPFSSEFYVIYLICGLSDVLDGAVARKTGSESKFGSVLDSIADFAFLAVCFVKIGVVLKISEWIWWAVGLIALIKLSCIVIEFIRMRRLASYHTVLNKAVGVMLFVLPLTLKIISINISAIPICAVAFIAAVDELVRIVKCKNDKS